MTSKKIGERADARADAIVSIIRNANMEEQARATGVYVCEHTGPIEPRRTEYIRLRDRIAQLKRRLPFVWRIAAASAISALALIPLEAKSTPDVFANVVTTEGKNAALTHFIKGSTYTASTFLGLIESTGYGFAGANGSGVAATNLMASVTAAGGASPANGWNEATTSQCAARGTPSWGTASAGALAVSSAVAFSILANGTTIKGCFLAVKSVAGVASVATTGSTAGMLYSAGLFTGGDKAVANGDTLSVTYTASL